MSDRIRQHLSTVIVALVVGALAGVTSSALAQEPEAKPTTDRPDAAQVFETAGLNADKVDNRHAVPYTTNRGKRAGKLVATNANGFLPSNILKPQWRVVQNKPGILADDKIGWGEVLNKPPGFADNVDNAGVTKIKITSVFESHAVAPGYGASYYIECPAGSLAVGGGYNSTDDVFRVHASKPHNTVTAGRWMVNARSHDTEVAYFTVWAVCMSTTPGGALVLVP